MFVHECRGGDYVNDHHFLCLSMLRFISLIEDGTAATLAAIAKLMNPHGHQCQRVLLSTTFWRIPDF
jgi:hypothetical protein